MTTAATPDLLFAVVVAHTHKEFDIHGPMNDDTWLMNAVCKVQDAGCHITMKTRAQRGLDETLEEAVVAVGRELELVHRPGLLKRLVAWA
jgi:hypothetical protein